MLLLWAIGFFVTAIILGITAFGGIAIAISFFTKVLFFISFLFFLISFILLVVERMQAKKNIK